MRLSRYIAQCGVASRRKAEELIAAGEIKVNGAVVTEQGVQIDPERDRVVYKGRRLQPEAHAYILLNKPRGYICTADDEQGRPTVLELLPMSGQRLYPVGRLDFDTEGLLLLTNDGDFAYHILHPRYQIEKHYQALVRGRVSAEQIRRLANGVELEDGMTAPAIVKRIATTGDNTLLGITIIEGRKRQVRRMCSAIGHPALQLRRVGLAFLTLEGVPVGKYRRLTAAEVDRLQKL